jgi:formate dehydrogenase subunit delta
MSSPEKSSPNSSHDDTASHKSTDDRLVYMANQIGKFFASQGAEKAPAAIAEHLTKFWDPRMRTKIVAHLNAGGAGLDPPVHRAIERLKLAAAGV